MVRLFRCSATLAPLCRCDIRQIAETGTLAPTLIALSLALGAIHALTPDHGKSIILSYFVGHGARVIDGLTMASKMAFSHSFTAIVLVLTLGAAVSKWGRPSSAAETLQMGSYGLIAAIGLYYLSQAIRHARPEARVTVHTHCPLLPVSSRAR